LGRVKAGITRILELARKLPGRAASDMNAIKVETLHIAALLQQ
jgi:hypothetical protein